MLSISIKHPDSGKFIDAKLESGKVTGANVSVKLTDEFMKAVEGKTTFRQQYPDLREQYTWWSTPTFARERNVGWRIDYFFITPELRARVAAAEIHADVPGSDHCPISLTLHP